MVRIGDVVEIRFVDEDRRLGRFAVYPCDELARGLRTDVGRGRVVRVAVEHQPGAFRALRELLEIDLELGIERHGPDRVAHHRRVARAFLVGWDRAEERTVLGGEEMRGRPQDLRRSAAEHDVLRLDVELLGDGIDQVAAGAGIPSGLPALGSERRLDRVEHGLAWAERVLIARQTNHPGFDRLQGGFERRPQAVLTATRADEGTGHRARGADSDGLDESTSRQHVASPIACRQPARTSSS